MQIYTRVGDKGYTNIIGGGKIAKDSSRVRAYGELDELNSNVGFAISCIDNEKVKKELLEIQKFIFDCGTDLADPQMKEKKIGKQTIEWLEERIDFYSDIPDEVESFILPGGSPGGECSIFVELLQEELREQLLSFNGQMICSKIT